MKKRLIIVLALSVLLVALGFSYAYFKTRIEGTGTPISAKAKELKIIYTDKMSISGTNIEPGWSESKTFSVKNESSGTYNYNIIFKNLINTFVTEGYLQYKITSTNGYNMTDYVDIPKSPTASDKVLASNIEIEAGDTQEYTIEFIYKTTEEDQSDDMGKTLSGTLAIDLYTAPTLVDTIKTAYTPNSGSRPSINAIYQGDPALYTGTDNQGTTYYFSGNGTNMNNWVSFAGKLWRIIRINGNGSVRLLYAGDGSSATDIGSSAFNSTYNHPSYVGWKYTNSGANGSLSVDRQNGTASTIYTYINSNWYSKLSAENKNYIDTNAIYCNDRDITSGQYSTSSTFYYAAYTRLSGNQAPIFTCNASDQFKDGFGLMTADEVVAAGGLYGQDSPKAYYYLNAAGNGSITGSNWWWTMSPCSWYGSYARMFFVYGSSSPGGLYYALVDDSYVVRPVVSLKSNVLVTGGSGTGSEPYTLTIQ